MPVKAKNRCSAIYAWHSNEFVENPKHELKSYIRAIEYNDLLQSDKEIKRCCDTFFNRVWEDIDKNSNNYVHANSRKCVQDNFIDTLEVGKRCLDELTQNIKIVSIYFISLLLLTNSFLFMSSDYIDFLECNQQPPENSQYWIASIYQKYFDKYIHEISPELLEYLRENNSHSMEIN